MSLLPSFTIAADGQEAVNNKLSRQSGYFSDLICPCFACCYFCLHRNGGIFTYRFEFCRHCKRKQVNLHLRTQKRKIQVARWCALVTILFMCRGVDKFSRIGQRGNF